MNYTPGPWTVVTQEDWHNGMHKWWWEIHVFEPGGIGSTCVAQVLDEDDARLIAAAPDLLQTLQLIEASPYNGEQILILARAAIAKARLPLSDTTPGPDGTPLSE